jgi:hypothetical protein
MDYSIADHFGGNANMKKIAAEWAERARRFDELQHQADCIMKSYFEHFFYLYQQYSLDMKGEESVKVEKVEKSMKVEAVAKIADYLGEKISDSPCKNRMLRIKLPRSLQSSSSKLFQNVQRVPFCKRDQPSFQRQPCVNTQKR